jgi:hypothetical protein
VAIAAGTAAAVVRTTNGGVTWTSLTASMLAQVHTPSPFCLLCLSPARTAGVIGFPMPPHN